MGKLQVKNKTWFNQNLRDTESIKERPGLYAPHAWSGKTLHGLSTKSAKKKEKGKRIHGKRIKMNKSMKQNVKKEKRKRNLE